MDLNRLLLWMTGVSCSLNLLYTVRGSDRPQRGWQGILVGLLVSLGIGLLIIPEFCGFIVGTAWVVLVILPGLVQRLSSRLMARRKYELARCCAQVSSWLHPFDGWRDHPEVIRALQLLHAGRTEEAKTVLQKLDPLDTSVGRMTTMVELQQTGGWEQLRAWLHRSYPPNTILRDENLLTMYLQSLGELGRRQEMLDTYQLFLEAHDASGRMSECLIQLRVAAFCGLIPTTDLLTEDLSSLLPDDSQQFWRLTARQVAGKETSADLEKLERTASPYLRPMVASRLSTPLPTLTPGELDAAATRTVNELVRRVAHEARYAVMHLGSRRRPYVTWGLAILLIACFIREIPGGSTDAFNLVNLGALVLPTSETPGEWWRIITAGLLHFGPLHLSMNLIGLLYLGPRLEQAWGRLRVLACYAVSTVTAMGLAPFMVTLTPDEPRAMLVGASGGVMGLVGALIGHLSVGWFCGRNRRISRQLGTLLLLVGLQTFFDLTTPNVSFACHLLGLMTGLCYALLVSGLQVFFMRLGIHQTV